MLWADRHKWPSGAQFTFNCCRHWATLVVWDAGGGSGHFLHSKEGVTHRDPLAMIACGIGFLPLIRELRGAHPRVTQHWYADVAGAGGGVTHILEHIWDLQAQGLARGYYPDPTKSILVVAPGNVAWAEEFFRGMGIKLVTGHRYLWGYIVDREAEGGWLTDKITGWAESVETLARVSCKHLQSAYAGLQKSLHQEWAFVQRVTPGIGDAFGPAEKALRVTFVSALFEGLGYSVPERGVTRLPVKQVGLALPDPTQTAPENWTTSCVITGHLVAALRGQVVFWTAYHSACLQEGWMAVRRRGQQWAEEALAATM